MNPHARMFLMGLGLPALDADLALGELKPSPALGHVADFLARPERRILVLHGATSCGKTIAAASWLASLQRYGKCDDTAAGWGWLTARARYVAAYEFGRLNLRYRDEDRARFDAWKSARWLVVDDLGAEPPDAGPLVEELVDARARFGWTVCTTNVPCGPKFDDSPFVMRYGARVADRILGNGVACGCGSANLRRGTAA